MIDIIVFVVGFLAGMFMLRGFIGGLVVGVIAYTLYTGIITIGFNWGLVPWI